MGYEITIDVKVLYFGALREDVINKNNLCKIMFIAHKKAITKNWYKPEPPSFKQWMDIVKEIFVMERMTFSLRSRGTTFLRKWEKWLDYITTEVDVDLWTIVDT